MWLNIELASIRSWIQNFLTSKPVTYANLNFSIPNSNLRAVLNQNKFERIQNKLLFAQFSTRHILPTQTTQIYGGRIRNEVFSFYIFDKLHYMHPPLFSFPPDISYCRSESYNLYVSGKYWLLRLHSISAKVYFPLFYFFFFPSIK